MAGVTLYDANGQVVPGARERLAKLKAETGFRAAARGRRAASWYPTSSSINQILSADAPQMVRRARQAFRNSAWAKSASDSYVSAVVGSGILPEFDVQDKTLRENLANLFEDFSDHCDPLGASDFAGLQEIACRGHFEAGDSFARLRTRRPADNLPIPLQLEMLDAEMCDYGKNVLLPGSRMVKGGIELNGIGQKKAYWMFKFHPGDLVNFSTVSNVSRAIPAANVLHVYHPLQAQQVRGTPGLSNVLAMLKDLEDTSDAYVLRTKIANLFATFEETPDDDSALTPPDLLESEVGTLADTLDDDGTPLRPVEPGSHTVMEPGHKLQFTTPPTDAHNYEDFLRSTLRGIAVGCGLTYEQLTGDLTKVNFSSIRAGLIEFRRMMEARLQRLMVFQFCRPMWVRVLQVAMLSGKISVPEEDMRRALRPDWIGTPGFEYVDPEKEVKADVRAVRSGFKSRSQIVAKGGRRRARLDEEIERERKDAESKDLVFDSDPKAVATLEADNAQAGDPGDIGEAGEA